MAQIIQPGRLVRTRTSRTTTPTSFAGLFAWYDAADESTLTLQAGNDVQIWDDKAGSQAVTQGTAADRPQTGQNTLGGRNVLTFNDDSINRGSFTTPSAMTFIILASIDLVDNGFDSVFSFNGNSSNTDFQFDANSGNQFDGRLNENGFAGGNADVLLTDGPYAGWHIFRLTLSPANGVSIYVDGDFKGIGIDWTNSIASDSNFKIMSNRAGSNMLGGKVAECLIYGTELSDDDASRLETDYLLSKWGPNATSGAGGGGGK